MSGDRVERSPLYELFSAASSGLSSCRATAGGRGWRQAQCSIPSGPASEWECHRFGRFFLAVVGRVVTELTSSM